MWPFKKKHKPKTLINSLKKSYEKIDFENEPKMSRLHTHLLSVQKSFNKNKDALNIKIEDVMDKAEKHFNDKFVLEKIEQDSAKELRELRSKEDTRENRTRIRKLTAALHSAQFKLSQFDREERDYVNTEKLLNSLYLDLEDCSNILEYMIGSLDRNLERVRAASFFTLSLSDLEENETGPQLEYTQSATRMDDVTYKAIKKGILSKIPIPGKALLKEPTVKTYPDTFEGRLEKIQDTLEAKAKEAQLFAVYTIEEKPGIVKYSPIRWYHCIKNNSLTTKDEFTYCVTYSPAYGDIEDYTLQELLTVKSDDVEGRTKIYESMVKGENTLEAGTPVSFDVLCNEIRGLGLNIQLEKKQIGLKAL